MGTNAIVSPAVRALRDHTAIAAGESIVFTSARRRRGLFVRRPVSDSTRVLRNHGERSGRALARAMEGVVGVREGAGADILDVTPDRLTDETTEIGEATDELRLEVFLLSLIHI